MCQTIRTGLRASGVVAGMLVFAAGPLQAQLQNQTQIRPTNDLPNPYERVHPWGELPNPYEPGAYDDRGLSSGPRRNRTATSIC